jgi:hypothetical protein
MSEITCTLKILNIADALYAREICADSTAHALPDEHYNIRGSAASGGLRRLNKTLLIGAFLRYRAGLHR